MTSTQTMAITFFTTMLVSLVVIQTNGLSTAQIRMTTQGHHTGNPTTPSITSSINTVTTSYASALTSNGSTYTRYGSSGRFYYETIAINVTTTGVYTFISNSSVDAYGYLYENTINASDLSLHLVAQDDDNGGNTQFRISYTLQVGRTYILIFTTYSENVTTSFSIIAMGPARANLHHINLILTSPSSNNMTMASSTAPSVTSSMNTVTTSYASALASNSSIFARYGSSGKFYYEAIATNVTTTGVYTFISNSSVDAYGYLYENTINTADLSVNLLTQDDDSGGNAQFRMSYTLQVGRTYILIFTTYLEEVTTPFSIIAMGPTRVSLHHINLMPTPPPTTHGMSSYSSSTPMMFTTGASSGCNRSNDQPICPGQVITRGRVLTVDPSNRPLTGLYMAPNNTFFNLNDSSTVNGYVQSVTVQYNRTHLPTARARVWIYGIVPILGSYMACSEYSVNSSRISTTQIVQTYTIPNNLINVFNGTYIAVGIEDTLASIATTFGGIALRLENANLSSSISTRGPLYFRPDNLATGVKISYTIVT